MFDVYVDGATGTSREAVRELASAMAARYGLPAAELEARLTRGRFRVKSAVDRGTAEAYLRDLAAIGARVRIEPAGEPPARGGSPGAAPARAALPPQPEARPARSSLPPQPEARPARSSLPPQPEARAMTSSLPPPMVSRPTHSSLPPQPEARPRASSLPPQPEARGMTSSLPPPSAEAPRDATSGGAAVRSTGPIRTLGALDRSGALSLATLDDEPAPAPASDGMLPASMGPAAPRPARPARARNEPLDPFAPPELATEEPLLELVDDDLAYRASKRASTPPAVADEAARRPAAAPQQGSSLPIDRSAPSRAPAAPSHGSPPSPGGPSHGSSRPLDPSQPPAASGQWPGPTLPSPGGPLHGSPRPLDPSQPPAASGQWPGPSLPAADSARWSSSPLDPSRAPGGPSAPPGGPSHGSSQPPADPLRRPGPSLAPLAASPGPAGGSLQGPPFGPPAPSPGEAAAGAPDAARSGAIPAAPAGLAGMLETRIPVLASSRARLVAGVALAIALGFIPAHLAAGMRERSAFGAIDTKIAAVQATADTPDSYAALDAFRAEQLDAKYSARRAIVVTSLLIWAAAGGALAYAWFRGLPWQRG